MDALGEGAEEFISECADWGLNKWLVGSDKRSFDEVRKDAWYSAFIGALTSVAMSGPVELFKSMSPRQVAQKVAQEMDARLETERKADALKLPEVQQATEHAAQGRTAEELALPTPGTETVEGVSETGIPIQEDMSDEDRYEALKDKRIFVPSEQKQTNPDYKEPIRGLESLKKTAKSKAEKVIYPLAEKLGILNKPYKTPDLDIKFTFSKNGGLSESIYRQMNYGGDYADFAKALINLDDVIKNAVLIEQHNDKYKGTVRENRNLQKVSVLMGLFRDGDMIIPVQMEIKHSTDGNRLYMTVAMTKIEAGVLESAVHQQDADEARSLIPTSEYSIADVIRNVNPADSEFLKYVPDGFLNEEQKGAKREAIAKNEEKIAGYQKKGDDLALPVPGQAAQDDMALPAV